jgi:hypothetical protein
VNERHGFVRPRWRRVGLLVAGLLACAALAGQVALAGQATGNNGTVKIHEGPGEPPPDYPNEPHVCTFHLHFFFADPEQAGTWEIQKWSPGPRGDAVLSGTYDTHGSGEDRQPEQGVYDLPNGHYKLFWDGDLDGNRHDKMKVFWVDCAAATPATETTPSPKVQPTPTESESTAPSAGQSGSPTAGASELPVGGTNGETPGPTGEDLAAAGVGGLSVTPPPTDTESTSGVQSSDGAWPLILLIVVAGIVMTLLVTPAGLARRGS